jgi:hypothetical protein
METYVGHIIQAAITVAGVTAALIRMYFALVSRIQKMETRLEIDDRGKADRDSARRLEMADIARGEINIHRSQCPARETTGVREMPVRGG